MVKKSEVKKESILILGAHTDDFVIGAGGTVAKYTKEGKKVVAIIFSYGKMGLPWLKEKVAQEVRTKETCKACDVLKCETIFYNLKENHFLEEYQDQKITEEILKVIEKEKPSKIFTHSHEDPHPDHKAVHQITEEVFEKINFTPKPEVYMYSVWNPISFQDYPALYVNVTSTFGTKMRALKTYSSQKIHVAYPTMLLIFRAIKDGFKIKTLFAEKFFRIR